MLDFALVVSGWIQLDALLAFEKEPADFRHSTEFQIPDFCTQNFPVCFHQDVDMV